MSGEEDKILSSHSIPVQICGRSFACNVETATAMPVSLVQSTKCALVSLLKSLAVKFMLVVNITRVFSCVALVLGGIHRDFFRQLLAKSTHRRL